MVDLYEFKIRLYFDDRDWSEIGTYDLRPGTAADAAAYAQQLASYEPIIEVRYNVRGTCHYVIVTDDENYPVGGHAVIGNMKQITEEAGSRGYYGSYEWLIPTDFEDVESLEFYLTEIGAPFVRRGFSIFAHVDDVRLAEQEMLK